MTYVAAEARQQLLDAIAVAIEQIGAALASLGEAYEQLEEHSADRLEAELFRPVQLAYGLANRTHAGFAQRHGLPSATFDPVSPGLPSRGVKGFVDSALEAVGEADRLLSALQDSMLPVEVGDAELRAGLAEVRSRLDGLAERARRFVSLLGR